MTGTPLENHVDDLASILEFVDQEMGEKPQRLFPGADLLARHASLQLRRRKADVLTELPPKQVIHLVLPLSPEQRETYDRAEQTGILQLKERGTEVRIQHVLELILRLKQICNFCPRTGASAKIDDIRTRLEVLGEEGHRALLFSQFVERPFGVQAAAEALSEFDPLTYFGGMGQRERDEVISRFARDPQHKVLVLSLKAGGTGLNLQEASYVFHLDRWWNPAIERQAEDRSHRMGQQFPVTVFKYTSEGTIEERIEQVLQQKQRLFDEIVDDVSIDLAGNLTGDELFGIFGMEPPRSAQRKPERSDGLALEQRCLRILANMGWTVRSTPRSRDGGIDLIASRVDAVGLELQLLVQCKDHVRRVGVEVVRELLGVLPPGGSARGVIAAPEGLTADAGKLAAERGISVWDGEALARFEGSE